MKETIMNVLCIISAIVSAIACALVIGCSIMNDQLDKLTCEIENCSECQCYLTLKQANAWDKVIDEVLLMKDRESR